MTDSLAEAWSRLVSGESMEGLDLPRRGGRIMLGSIKSPGVSVVSRRAAGRQTTETLAGVTVLRGVRWGGLDLSGALLANLRFMDCEIVDCVLEGASLRGTRFWGTTVAESSFVRCDLRDCALGGHGAERNVLKGLDLSGADLRGSVHGCTEVTRCRFDGAKLRQVDFRGSAFSDCVFKGTLEEVMFHDTCEMTPRCPANRMAGVDFREATLRNVEFRGLDMDGVVWPESDEHVQLTDYCTQLDLIIRRLKANGDPDSTALAAGLAVDRRWAGPHRKRGVLNRKDLAELGSERVADEIVATICGG